MTSSQMLASVASTVNNAHNFLAFGVIYSQADKLATADAEAILAAAAFDLSTPTPENVDAMHAYASAMDAAAFDYATIVEVSKAYAMKVPNPNAVTFG